MDGRLGTSSVAKGVQGLAGTSATVVLGICRFEEFWGWYGVAMRHKLSGLHLRDPSTHTTPWPHFIIDVCLVQRGYSIPSPVLLKCCVASVVA